MQRTRAWIVVRAAARMKVLGRQHSSVRREDADADADAVGRDLEEALLFAVDTDNADAERGLLLGDSNHSVTSSHGPGARTPNGGVLSPATAVGGSAATATGRQGSSVAFSPLPPSRLLLPPSPPSASPARSRRALLAGAAAAAATPGTAASTPGGGGGAGAGGSERVSHSIRRERSRASLADAALASRPLTPLPAPSAWHQRDAAALREMLAASPFNVLLICVPLGYAARYLNWGQYTAVAVFVLNFAALVPLALLLGDVTEDLALRFGDVVGGLLNATFGNVVEVVLALAALRKRLYTVVATSLLGSILSNLLLVLGCCFWLGGLRHHEQRFNPTANQATSSLLFLACIALLVPTAAATLGGVGPKPLLHMSRGVAVVLLLIYACYLVFQLYSHAGEFAADADADEPALTLPAALLALTLITAAVTGASELLTGAIEEFSAVTGLSQVFVGLIILPIAGNACEHVVAVLVALRNKMDLAVGVAVGSSVQIALFAIPLAVVAGWVMGRDMSLNFPPVSTLALTVAVLHANFVTALSSSHWLMGVQLIATYVVLALAFLYM